MQKIVPNLWFDGNAREASEFYISLFQNSSITGGSRYPESTAEGLADFQQELAGKDLTIEFNLAGYNFVAINAGPDFKPTPAISFMINFDPSRDDQAHEHLDELWNALAEEGEVLMPIGEHPFSKRYGWVIDKFGFSWQLILTNPEGEPRPLIMPSLLFSSTAQNRAKEAINYYASVFNGSKIGNLAPYPQQVGPDNSDAIAFGEFNIGEQWFVAMDSGVERNDTFTEAISFSVSCRDQSEIDALWEKLSAVPDVEQCGWCKDKFGVSWQIVPENMEQLMQQPDAFARMMQMKKIVIADF